MSQAIEQATVLQNLLRRVTASEPYARLLDEIRSGARTVSVSGLPSVPARALALSVLQRTTGKTFALVTEANRDLEVWERDVRFWYCALHGKAECDETVLLLPAAESDPYAGASPHAETLEQRALTLWRLAQRKSEFVLLTARALARRTVTPEKLKSTGVILMRDQEYAPETLVEKLIASGYVREDPISAIGEFSLRGGILDVWPPTQDAPVRIEFFGDTVDSLREFDPETQLSTKQLRAVEIAPMRELAATADDFCTWAERARDRWSDERYERALRDRTIYAIEGETFAGWEWLIPPIYPTPASAFDYLRDVVFVIDEPSAIESHLGKVYEQLAVRYAETEAADELGLAPDELYLTAAELRARLDRTQRLELRALGRTAATVDAALALDAGRPSDSFARPQSAASSIPASAPLFLFPAIESITEVEWAAQSVRRYHGRVNDLANDLRRALDERRASVLLVMHSLGVAERVAEMLTEYKMRTRLIANDERGGDDFAQQSEAFITIGRISNGFQLPSANLIVHVEGDLFAEAQEQIALERTSRPPTEVREKAKRKSKTAAFISDFRDLKPGDFVVHIDHGIGRFNGLQTLDLNGKRGEFMLLTYADDAKLYVPVERLDLVQRYASAEGGQPQLDRLGGLGWQKAKARAKRAIRDMADELLRLYAERKLVGGYAFASDTPWQREFEEGFEYTLTPDQETAIKDVKQDMEEAVPMDRLLCGDVGYGKTEVAMRAAFKAVMDGKQVAVLTPTTVLAYQHFDTFRARFAAFPVRIELLSRFRSAKEQKEIVKRIEASEIDIIIGTHRILSKDIKFRELGLVVVDEEQRFGVAHKERLKQLKKRVDVLTLSATPIPRTLNMSLTGLRDMSVIETPPRDRLAINTQVVQFSESVIKSAIELELGRGGQVFFIHNRVESIETIAALIKRLVPQARIAVGHGQMNEQEMERVMLDFVDYKYDVLVATTIIENGIDIPRANTIIINRADTYGLAQLYQLRGRVGRSNRRAYAYLLIPSEQGLTPVARRRLAAIREFSDLGAGFRIAALDLELRGAGNFLGGEQSGHMDALGFDLYTQMLERTVAELRGEEVEDETSVSLNLGVDVTIPEDYISDMGQRLRTYKRISSARDDEMLSMIATETKDRYGRLPQSVERLFDYARLRRLAERINVTSIDRTPSGIAIKLSEKAHVAPEKLMRLVGTRAGASFAPSGVLRLDLNEDEEDTALDIARRVLLEIRAED
jgi:transcription-repair coupling factor (superfamily II helicase)